MCAAWRDIVLHRSVRRNLHYMLVMGAHIAFVPRSIKFYVTCRACRVVKDRLSSRSMYPKSVPPRTQRVFMPGSSKCSSKRETNGKHCAKASAQR